MFTKLKFQLQNFDSLSFNALISGMIVYTVDNYYAICGALTLIATTTVTVLTKYNNYQQDKLDRTQTRSIELKKAELDLKEKEVRIFLLKESSIKHEPTT